MFVLTTVTINFELDENLFSNKWISNSECGFHSGKLVHIVLELI